MAEALTLNPRYLTAEGTLDADALRELIAEMHEVTRNLTRTEGGPLHLAKEHLQSNAVSLNVPAARDVIDQMVRERFLTYTSDGSVTFAPEERDQLGPFEMDGPTATAIGVVLVVGGVLIAILAALFTLIALPTRVPWLVLVGIVLLMLGLVMAVVGIGMLATMGKRGGIIVIQFTRRPPPQIIVQPF